MEPTSIVLPSITTCPLYGPTSTCMPTCSTSYEVQAAQMDSVLVFRKSMLLYLEHSGSELTSPSYKGPSRKKTRASIGPRAVEGHTGYHHYLGVHASKEPDSRLICMQAVDTASPDYHKFPRPTTFGIRGSARVGGTNFFLSRLPYLGRATQFISGDKLVG